MSPTQDSLLEFHGVDSRCGDLWLQNFESWVVGKSIGLRFALPGTSEVTDQGEIQACQVGKVFVVELRELARAVYAPPFYAAAVPGLVPPEIAEVLRAVQG